MKVNVLIGFFIVGIIGVGCSSKTKDDSKTSSPSPVSPTSVVVPETVMQQEQNKESTIIIRAQVAGIVRKIFVDRNSSIDSEKVIAMISPENSKSQEYHIIRSPGSGTLSRVNIQEGDSVVKGERLFEFTLEED